MPLACPSVLFLVAGILAAPAGCQGTNRPKRPVPVLHPPKDTSQPEQKAAESDHEFDFGTVLKLNDNIFHGNVLREKDVSAEHWIVLWCYSWYEKCQEVQQTFVEQAAFWQGKLNKNSVLKLAVRFGQVDCAIDKILCNQLEAEGFPALHHFRGGEKIGVWPGRYANDLHGAVKKWLASQLGSIDPDAGGETPEYFMISYERAKDVLVVLFLLGINFWAVTQNPDLWQKATSMCSYASSATRDSAAEHSHADAPTETPRTNGDVPAEPQAAGVERLLPEEWLRQRNNNGNSMEL